MPKPFLLASDDLLALKVKSHKTPVKSRKSGRYGTFGTGLTLKKIALYHPYNGGKKTFGTFGTGYIAFSNMKGQQTMESIGEALDMILAPLGLKARPFLVDYSDNAGADYNIIAYPPPNCDDETIAASLIDSFGLQGYTVNMITEILHGYGKAEIEALADSNPEEAAKHIKILYLTE